MNLAGFVQRWRRCQLAWLGVRVDRSCSLGADISLGLHPQLLKPGAVRIGKECEVGHRVELNPWGGHIYVGRHVFIGPGCVIYGQGGVEIGDHTLIAPLCGIFSSNHTVPPMDKIIRNEPDMLLPTKIGRDVWLGAGVKVLGGVTIDDSCVVGAGSVVTKDLPKGSVAVGNPAQVIKFR